MIETGFFLENTPMPPTSNKSYWAKVIKRGGKSIAILTPSTELKKFQDGFRLWSMQNSQTIKAGKLFCDEVATAGQMLCVDVYAFFPRERLWCKDGSEKRLDGSNRIKALHDCLADALGIDDSCFWSSSIEKVESESGKEFCTIAIRAITPRKSTEVEKELP